MDFWTKTACILSGLFIALVGFTTGGWAMIVVFLGLCWMCMPIFERIINANQYEMQRRGATRTMSAEQVYARQWLKPDDWKWLEDNGMRGWDQTLDKEEK